MKKSIFYIIFVIILIIVILFLLFTVFTIHKNHTIIKKIDNANSSYITDTTRNFHIKIERKSSVDNDLSQISITDIYRKEFIIKEIIVNDNNTYMYYQNTDSQESYFFNLQENSVIGYGKSLTNEFQNFLQLYYANMPGAKILVNNEYYIINFPTSNYYFDKETFRIVKSEVFKDKKILQETTYTYFDNEEITDEMVSKPQI